MASDPLGVSGRAMLEALVAGTHDPQVLAELARGRLRAKLPALREALQGRFGTHHGLLVAEMLARIDQMDETIGRLSAEVARVATPFLPLLALLGTIPGVSRRTAEVLLAEIGPDMGRFSTAAHLASWAGSVLATTSRPASIVNRHGFRAVFIWAAAPVGVQHSGRPRARQGSASRGWCAAAGGCTSRPTPWSRTRRRIGS